MRLHIDPDERCEYVFALRPRPEDQAPALIITRNPLQPALLAGRDRVSIRLLQEVAMDKGQAFGMALWIWFFGAALAWSVLSLIERPLIKTK